MTTTSIEQSKKLLELGLNPESADMWWSRITIISDDGLKIGYSVEPCNLSEFNYTKKDIPAWSLGVLLELIPKRIRRGDHIYGILLYWQSSLHKWTTEYACNLEFKPLINNDGDTPLEAAYNMVKWLLENGYIKT